MNALKNNWKALVALILTIAAIAVYFLCYRPGKAEFETRTTELNTSIAALQSTAAENLRYAAVQDKLPAAMEELQNSRLELYEHFPAELKEEDQIMYVVYLEERFGTHIDFSFAAPEPIVSLRDGSVLCGVALTVNYQTSYEGFKEMISYLSADSRIASIQHASMEYDPAADTATGTLTLVCYTVDSPLLEYTAPEIPTPSIGKSNLFG